MGDLSPSTEVEFGFQQQGSKQRFVSGKSTFVFSKRNGLSTYWFRLKQLIWSFHSNSVGWIARLTGRFCKRIEQEHKQRQNDCIQQMIITRPIPFGNEFRSGDGESKRGHQFRPEKHSVLLRQADWVTRLLRPIKNYSDTIETSVLLLSIMVALFLFAFKQIHTDLHGFRVCPITQNKSIWLERNSFPTLEPFGHRNVPRPWFLF